MKFNINDYKDRANEYVMHCKTPEEAEDFRDYMIASGQNNKLYHLNEYADVLRYFSKKETELPFNIAYDFNNDSFCSVSYIKFMGCTVLEWSDFMDREEPDASKESDSHTEESLKSFTKADLKTGDVIQRRNGRVEIVNRELGMFICQDGWNDLVHIKEDLTTTCLNNGYDIVAVRRPKDKADCRFSAFKMNWGDLVYKREDPVEMTLSEVCKLLGKTIRIVPEP